MPFTSDDAKPPLLDEQLRLRNAQATWLAIGGGTVASPVPDDAKYVPVLLSIVMLTILRRQDNAVSRALVDPPRPDYATRTRPRSRRYHPGHLGEGPVAVFADRAALATLRSAAYLEAMVRADERAQAAHAAGRSELERDRLEEAIRMVEAFKANSWSMAEELEAVALAFAGPGQRQADAAWTGAPLGTVDLLDRMPTQARRALSATGLVVDDLSFRLEERDAVPSLAQATTELVRAVAELGFSMRSAATRVASRRQPRLKFAVEPPDAPQVRRQPLARGPRAEEALATGIEALEEGRPAAAQRWLEEAAEGGAPEAHRQLGLLRWRQGDLAAALHSLETATTLGSGDAPADLGAALEDLARLAEAESAYRIAIERGSPSGAMGLARLLLERGRSEEANRVLRDAERLLIDRLSKPPSRLGLPRGDDD